MLTMSGCNGKPLKTPDVKLSIKTENNLYITAKWLAVENATDYEVEYYFDDIKNVVTKETNNLDINIERKKGILNLRVRAVGSDKFQPSKFSDWQQLKIDGLALYPPKVALKNNGTVFVPLYKLVITPSEYKNKNGHEKVPFYEFCIRYENDATFNIPVAVSYGEEISPQIDIGKGKFFIRVRAVNYNLDLLGNKIYSLKGLYDVYNDYSQWEEISL